VASNDAEFTFEFERDPRAWYLLGFALGDGFLDVWRIEGTTIWRALEFDITNERIAKYLCSIGRDIIKADHVVVKVKPPVRGRRSKPGKKSVYRVFIVSDEVSDWFLKYRNDYEMLKRVLIKRPKHAKEYIRGFFDAEGYFREWMYKRVRKGRVVVERRARIKIVNNDKKLLEVV